MDEYGCMRVTEEDAKSVRTTLDSVGATVFALSGDQVGAMIVCVTTKFTKIGTMPFGGNPTGRAYVGVYGRGCNHLSKDDTHASYLADKLHLADSDAETLAAFWRMIWK